MGSPERLRWYSSFYWRIGLSFVVLVLVVLVAQSIMFGYLLERQGTMRPPGTVATEIALELGAVLARDPRADLGEPLRRHADAFPSIYVMLKDGRTFATVAAPLADDIRRDTEAALLGAGRERPVSASRTRGPVVSAPIQVGSELRGMVVMPPPPRGGVLQEIGRLLSLPGTLLLAVATVVAAVVIFGPARRRLAALERAAEELGQGDLAARAPESGRDEIGRVARAFNRMAEDLSARDEALRTSDRLRRQMLADVSHELKTPLTAMLGYLDTLQMTEVPLDPPTRARYLAIVAQETRRLDRIVKDLLDLARYEGGGGTLEVRVFAIERVFGAVARRYEREAGARQVALTIEVAPDADQVVGDPDRLEQVVDNLVANALRHTPAGGAIELRAAASVDGWTLTVADSGEGIAPEHLPHVFDRFYKVDAARASASGGSGLGLSIAQAIVRRHGGTIRVTSCRGRTEFTIDLSQRIDRGDPDST